MRTQAPLLAPVFRSDGQARLLAVVMLGEDELSITDLAARARLAYPTAHREVARLVEAGILTEREVGRTRLIRANPLSPLTEPLRQILLVATGPVALLAEEFDEIANIESAFLYGSFAARMQGVEGPAPQDIDVMVVGTPDAAQVYDACERVERLVGRPVNPTIATRDELGRQTGFLDHVRANPIVLVMGESPVAVTALTTIQQRAVDELVANGRLAVVPSDLAKARIFMRQAQDIIDDLPNLTKPQNRYNLAYDACHDVGEAMLAAHGYRTLSGPGQHEAIGRFLRAVIDRPPGDREARRFDVLRRARNRQRYDAKPVGEAEAGLAAETAAALFSAALARGMPQG